MALSNPGYFNGLCSESQFISFIFLMGHVVWYSGK